MAGLAGLEAGAEAEAAGAWLSAGEDDVVAGCFGGTAVVADVLMRWRGRSCVDRVVCFCWSDACGWCLLISRSCDSLVKVPVAAVRGA
jgi:hypothetical protein